MTCFEPFRALRPAGRAGAGWPSRPPYDVVTRREAGRDRWGKSVTASCASSVRRPTFRERIPYSEAVYRRGAANLNRLGKDGAYFADERAAATIFTARRWTGVLRRASSGGPFIDDYENGVIKRHEVTRTEKELDRIRHFEAVQRSTRSRFSFSSAAIRRSLPIINKVITGSEELRNTT